MDDVGLVIESVVRFAKITVAELDRRARVADHGRDDGFVFLGVAGAVVAEMNRDFDDIVGLEVSWIERVATLMPLGAVEDAVAVRVGRERVGAEDCFLFIGKPIAVRVGGEDGRGRGQGVEAEADGRTPPLEVRLRGEEEGARSARGRGGVGHVAGSPMAAHSSTPSPLSHPELSGGRRAPVRHDCRYIVGLVIGAPAPG